MHSAQLAWGQILGQRQSQQDVAGALAWPNGFRLLLLADGMGGHIGGEIASALVVDTFKTHFVQSEEPDIRSRLISSLEAANKAICTRIAKDPSLKGMGTTLLAVAFDGLSIQWISIGDSPLWLVRGGELRQINEDHSMSSVFAKRVAQGEMSAEEAAKSPERSQLLEAVMGREIEILDAPIDGMALQEGDVLMLASDGVEACPPEQLLAIVTSTLSDPEALTNKVLDSITALGRQGQDNASLVTLTVLSTNREPLPAISTALGADEVVTLEPGSR